MRTHGEHGVQKQYTLIGPFSQAAVIRNVAATILVQFLINVDKGRRDLHIRLDGEAKGRVPALPRGTGSCPRITTLTLESGVNAKALKISSAGG